MGLQAGCACLLLPTRYTDLQILSCKSVNYTLGPTSVYMKNGKLVPFTGTFKYNGMKGKYYAISDTNKRSMFVFIHRFRSCLGPSDADHTRRETQVKVKTLHH